MTLGQTWVNLVDQILRLGTPMGDEGLELLGVSVAFPAINDSDEILLRFADQRTVAEMKQVFFTQNANSLGHSYANLIRGPDGRHDLTDVIALLGREPRTKRALVTLSGEPGGKVPCVNAVQFLVREDLVQTMYFARGQDAFRKFYADAICLATMAQTVAGALGIPAGMVRGFIGSSHLYHHDVPAIRQTLSAAAPFLATSPAQGALA